MTENEPQKISFFNSINRKDSNYKQFRRLSFLSFFKNLFVNKEELNHTNFLIQQIKNISNSDYEKFNQYLFNQKHIYDAKVNYVSTAIIEAQQDWIKKGNGSDDRNILNISEAKILKSYLEMYHTKMKYYIQDFSETYNKIHLGFIDNKVKVNLDSFVETYSLFKNNSYNSDDNLEFRINSVLFNDKSGTMEYFQKNDVYSKAMALELKLSNDEPTLKKSKNGI